MDTLPGITHVIGSLALSAGGPPRSVKGLCESLARVGCPVKLCTVDLSASVGPSVAIDQSLVSVLSVPSDGRFSKLLCPRGFDELLREPVQEADVVHMHGIWMPAYRCTAQMAMKYRKPLVISLRGVLDPLSFGQKRWKKDMALLWYARKSLDYAGCCIAAAPLEEAHFREFGIKGPVAVIPNGLTVWPYLKRERQSSREWLDNTLPKLKGKRILLYLARLHPQKGTVFLIDAWAALHRKFPDWHLVIAGPDSNGHQAELEARAKRHGCSRSITFLGEVYGSRKATVYCASDLFILPSISESFPRVVLEALAAAVPVIATTGAPWEDLIKYKCGWWVDAALGPLTEAMQYAMSLTDEQRHQAGLRGRELVVGRYDWSTIAAQTVSMYHWLRCGGTPPEFVHVDTSGGVRSPKPAAGAAGLTTGALAMSPAVAAVVETTCASGQQTMEPKCEQSKPDATIHCIHAIHSLAASAGGPTTATIAMAEHLARDGVKVDLCCFSSGEDSAEVDKSLVSVYRVPGMKWRLAKYMVQPRYISQLSALACEGSVINSHGLWIGVDRAVSRCARELHVPHVLSIDGMLSSTALARSHWKKTIAGSVYAHRILDRCSCLHALTTAELADARRYGAHRPIAVIPNGVDTARYSRLSDPSLAFERWPVLKNKRIMLFLARIHPIKGLEPLVSVWAKVAREHPDWTLVIAGPDETGLRAKLEQIVKGKTGDRTVFTGAVYGETKDALLAAAEVFTMTSYSEGFSNSILEAMACGLPALISPQCNFPKVSSAGAGWLVEPKECAIEATMREVLGMSESQLQAVGERGRTLVQQEYDWVAIAAKMKQVYQWLLGKGNQPDFVENYLR